MPATFEPIATTTLGSASTEITFSSIPNTYTDLRLIVVFFKNSTSSNFPYNVLRFNSDSGNNYSSTILYGDGASATSTRLTSYNAVYGNYVTQATTTTPVFVSWDIFNYAGSTNKTVLCRSAADLNGSGSTEANVGLWRSTSAITTINCRLDGNSNFGPNTTATLYGILKA